MTRYFNCKVSIYDEEDYHTVQSLKTQLEEAMDRFTEGKLFLIWEEVRVKEVEMIEFDRVG